MYFSDIEFGSISFVDQTMIRDVYIKFGINNN